MYYLSIQTSGAAILKAEDETIEYDFTVTPVAKQRGLMSCAHTRRVRIDDSAKFLDMWSYLGCYKFGMESEEIRKRVVECHIDLSNPNYSKVLEQIKTSLGVPYEVITSGEGECVLRAVVQEGITSVQEYISYDVATRMMEIGLREGDTTTITTTIESASLEDYAMVCVSDLED